MTDPLSQIEDRQAQKDLGAVAHRIYVGAREDGASRWTAFVIVVAWLRSLTLTEPAPPEEST